MTLEERIAVLESTQATRNLAMKSKMGGWRSDEFLAEAVYRLSETVDKLVQYIPISNDRRKHEEVRKTGSEI
jgi:hypothetical protein